jgi:phosphatidylglycerophosphate synthase
MLDERLRPVKERLLAPLAAALGRGLSPMLVTLAAFAVGLGAALCAARGAYGAGLALWVANRVLDGLDGTLARVQGRQTELGGYVDLLLDFVVYAAVPIGLALGAGDGVRDRALVAALALLASFYVNAASWMYLAAVLERRGAGAAARGELTTVTMPAGLVGGTETVVGFALFFLLPQHLVALFWAMAALVAVTVVQRLAWAVRTL